MAEKFSLKDQLFNPAKVMYLTELIGQVYPEFQADSFHATIVEQFPQLELKQRITWIRENLQAFLPQDYRQAVTILLQSLPPECDPTKTDDDFGDFIFAPYGEFIAVYGCNQKDLEFSLDALHQVTRRFSAEEAIRYFLNAFPEHTLNQLEKWAQDANYHVRRLTSEGTRPSLPWAQKVTLNHQEVINRILNRLFYDPTRYVVRSVANHLNDIAKVNPQLVIQTLKNWHQQAQKEPGLIKPKELDFLTAHATRTLVKRGDSQALELLGYNPNVQVKVADFQLSDSTLKLDQPLEFSFTITNETKTIQKLMVDYQLYFASKNQANSRKFTRQKVFKLKKIQLKAGESIKMVKKHPLRSNMTTLKIYPGPHQVSLQVNGQNHGSYSFQISD